LLLLEGCEVLRRVTVAPAHSQLQQEWGEQLRLCRHNVSPPQHRFRNFLNGFRWVRRWTNWIRTGEAQVVYTCAVMNAVASVELKIVFSCHESRPHMSLVQISGATMLPFLGLKPLS
jgi:hypothetical protein